MRTGALGDSRIKYKKHKMCDLPQFYSISIICICISNEINSNSILLKSHELEK